MTFFSRISAIHTSLFICAGAAVMYLAGGSSPWIAWSGFAVLIGGAGLAPLLTRAEERKKAAIVLSGAWLVNLYLYQSAELSALLDVSLLIHTLLALSLLAVAWQLGGLVSLVSTPYAPVAVLYVIASALSIYSADSLKEVAYFTGFLVIAVSAHASVRVIFSSDSAFRTSLIRFFFLGGLLSASLAVWQLFFESFKTIWYPYLATRDRGILELWEEVSRVVGMWQHPSYLGLTLALGIIAGCAWYFWLRPTSGIRIAILLGLILMGATLLLTNTRSSVLAAGLGVGALYFFSRGRQSQLRHFFPSARSFAIIGLVATLALVLYQFVFVAEIYTKPQAWRVDASATIWGRFLQSDSMSQESIVERGELYRLGLDAWRAHPLTGIGAKNFPAFVTDMLSVPGTDAHNIFVQALAETGALGFSAIICLLWVMFFRIRSAIGRGGSARKEIGITAAFCAMAAVFVFDSFFNNPLFSLRLTSIFWLMLAALETDTTQHA